MTSDNHDLVDLSALVDIISNVAGMMILLACVAIIIRHEDLPEMSAKRTPTKPISFPLSYIPNKRSLTLCLKYDNLYELPEKELLEAVSQKTSAGETVEVLRFEDNGIDAVIELTPTITGFRFKYRLNPHGGVKLRSSQKTVEIFNDITKRFPPRRFFYVFHTWPESFEELREIREYLLEIGVEVGWTPRVHEPKSYDIVYSMGEYDENLTTIKAQ